MIPSHCPGVPAEVLDPRLTWSDKGAYDVKARELAALFRENFSGLGAKAMPHVESAGPPA